MRYRRLMLAISVCQLLLPYQAARAEDLLYLSPVVNGVAKDGVVAVLPGKNGILISPEDLASIGILAKAGRDAGSKIMIPAHGEASATVDMQDQVIRFSVPDSDLLSQITAVSTPSPLMPARSGTGAFLNYAFSLTPPIDTGHNRIDLAAAGNVTGVVFSPYGFLSSDAILKLPQSSSDEESLITRLNTTYEFDQPEIPRAWRLGDIVTGPPGWGRAEFLGGVHLASDYALQPNQITFPTPIIGQTLAQPSNVSLLVNNVEAYSGNADAGPFSLVGIPVISGLNEITVQSRAASGQVISQSVPFYASSTMLKPGLASYNVSLGFIRHHYGQTDDYYSTPAFDFTVSTGLTDSFTASVHSEAAPNLVLLGPGGEASGVWGDLQAAAAISEHRRFELFKQRSGRLLAAEYSRSSPVFGFSGGIVKTTPGYEDLGLETLQSYPVLNWHVSATATLPYRAGNVALGYTEESVAAHDQDGFVLASYSRQITGALAFSVSCFRGNVRSFEINRVSDGCDAGITLALGSLGTAGASADFGSEQNPEFGETYQHYPPGPQGFGGSATNFMGNYTSRNLQLRDVTRYADVAANLAQNGGAEATEFDASGSVIAMDGLYFSRPTNNSFAVVDFGYPKIPIYLANQPIGQTGHSGRALIPDLIPNDPNELSLDANKLPMSVSIEDDAIAVTPPTEGGVLVRFPLQKLDAELLDVRLRDGSAPPAGSLLYLRGEATPIIVGYDGYVYLQNPPGHVTGTIVMSTGQCRIDLRSQMTVRNALVGIPVTCAD